MDILISDHLDRQQLLACIDAALKSLEEKGVGSFDHIGVSMNTYRKGSLELFHIKGGGGKELYRIIVHHKQGVITLEDVVSDPPEEIVSEINDTSKQRNVVKTIFALLGVVFLGWLFYLYLRYGWKEIVDLFPFTSLF